MKKSVWCMSSIGKKIIKKHNWALIEPVAYLHYTNQYAIPYSEGQNLHHHKYFDKCGTSSKY